MSAVRLCPEPFLIHGGCGEVVNTSDCGSDIRGFDSFNRPIIVYISGCSLMAKPQPSKLMLWVRLSPLHYFLLLFHSSSVVELSAVNRSVVGSSPTCGAMAPWSSVKTPPFHGGNTGSSPVGVIQTEVKYRFCFIIYY